MRPGVAAEAGGSMSYGEDIIMSDGFEPDEEDDFDSVAYKRAYESQFRKDYENGGDDDQAPERQPGAPRVGLPGS
jgi:hypothetical protein